MKQTNQQIVILGAGYAGLLATLRLARLTRGLNTHITLVNKADVFVERIRLHEQAVRKPARVLKLAQLLRGTRVAFVQGCVQSLDVRDKHVHVQTNSGAQAIPYDKLVVALGSSVDVDALPGAREYAHALTPESVGALHSQLAAPSTQTVLICGGGLTGIEAAAEFAEAHRHLRITLATRGQVGENLSDKARAHIRRVFARLGITLRENVSITRIQSKAAHTAHEVIPFDVCVWAGSVAVPALAREAGLQVNARGQIEVDATLHSVSHAEVVAVGDAAAVTCTVPIRMACATANPMAALAANNLAAELRGKAQQPFVFGYLAKNISLGRKDGVIDFAQADDTPRGAIWTGRLAAAYKEFVGRTVLQLILMERYWSGMYQVQPRADKPGFLKKPGLSARAYLHHDRSV